MARELAPGYPFQNEGAPILDLGRRRGSGAFGVQPRFRNEPLAIRMGGLCPRNPFVRVDLAKPRRTGGGRVFNSL